MRLAGVQRFVEQCLDVLWTSSPRHPARRMVAGRYRLALSHGFGGGSEVYLRANFLAPDEESGRVTILATPRGRFVRLVADGPGGSARGLVSQRWLVRRFVSQPASMVVLNGLPGWRPTRELLAAVAILPPSTELVLPLHDYYPVCPSFHLLDATGTYCGIPQPDVCESCFPVIVGGLASEFEDIAEWRRAWALVLRRADVVTAFSVSSVELLKRAHSFVKPDVAAHRLPVAVQRPDYSLERSILPRVALFGTITEIKGANVLLEMARLAARRGHFIEWHVFGDLYVTDVTVSLPSIKTHGRYSVVQMATLLEEYQISAAVLPSVVPETFSFVAEELASMSVPFSAFPLGAPHERLRDNPLVFFAERMTAESLMSATLEAIEAGWHRFAPDSDSRPDPARPASPMIRSGKRK